MESKNLDTKPASPKKSPKPTEKAPVAKPAKPLFKALRLALLGVISVLLLGGILVYTFTPAVLRKPTSQHYHLRLQVIADGKAVNFATSAFQEGYSKDNCSGDLTAHPFHFHDNRDQMVHVHWDDMTGGLLLKNYGWNFINGPHNTLGYRFDQLPSIPRVPIHSNALPPLADGDKLYVYTGDEHRYKARPAKDFLHQDLETFLGKKSNLGQDAHSSILDKLFPKAYAHGGEHHDTSPGTADQANLADINNLLGNVVIFAQKNAPSDAQVKARFDHLIPLEASTCGG